MAALPIFLEDFVVDFLVEMVEVDGVLEGVGFAELVGFLIIEGFGKEGLDGALWLRSVNSSLRGLLLHSRDLREEGGLLARQG